MSLLSIVQDAWRRLGIEDDVPSGVVASSNASVRVLRALATQEGRELASRAAWQRLVREHTFTTVAAETQVGAVPSDLVYVIPGTIWNYTEREPLLGPVDAAEWQRLKAGLVGPPDLYFRLRGNDFLIIPDPPAGEEIRFEYVSSLWVDTDGDGTADAADWVADTNTAVLSEELITLGIIWRWLKRNRLPYADEFAEYKVQVDQHIARDGVKRTINMGGAAFTDELRVPRVPDGSWNL